MWGRGNAQRVGRRRLQDFGQHHLDAVVVGLPGQGFGMAQQLQGAAFLAVQAFDLD
jgi:hypothetical protein